MSVLTRITLAYSASPPLYEPCIEIKCSKTREEKRYIENCRRPSIFEEEWERCTERRGSKDTTRRKSVVEAQMKKRRGSLGDKQEVLVVVGPK
jgi:hypothetical protein